MNANSYEGLGVGGGCCGVGEAGRRVAVGAAGRLVAVGGTVVGVGVSVTSGVGVMVGVSVGMGVGLSTGVGEWVDVGVKVGLGVRVDVGVAVGDATNEVREQPSRLTVTNRVTSTTAVVAASDLPFIKSAYLLSPREAWQQAIIQAKAGVRESPAFGKKSILDAHRWHRPKRTETTTR